jgi:tryptophan-rich sensory protein
MYKTYILNWKKLFIGLLSALLTGLVSGYITKDQSNTYDFLIKSIRFPPREAFPIVWTILFLLMGIGFYLVLISDCRSKGSAIYTYILQLAVNFVFPIIFFIMKAYTFSLIWEIILWFAVAAMIILFYKCSKAAAFLQIPYLLWITYAIYLTYDIVKLN